MKTELIIFFLLQVIHFHLCKPNGEPDADLTALEDDGDKMEVEDRAASGYCPLLRPVGDTWCSDNRWFTHECNQVGKQSIFNAKQFCDGRIPYDQCLYYYISRHRYDRPYCWPCNCRAIYTIGCDQKHLEKKEYLYLLEKFMC